MVKVKMFSGLRGTEPIITDVDFDLGQPVPPDLVRSDARFEVSLRFQNGGEVIVAREDVRVEDNPDPIKISNRLMMAIWETQSQLAGDYHGEKSS